MEFLLKSLTFILIRRKTCRGPAVKLDMYIRIVFEMKFEFLLNEIFNLLANHMIISQPFAYIIAWLTK